VRRLRLELRDVGSGGQSRCVTSERSSAILQVMDAKSAPACEHYGQVLRFARRRAASAADAEDVTQEVFLELAAKLAGSASTGSPTLGIFLGQEHTGYYRSGSSLSFVGDGPSCGPASYKFVLYSPWNNASRRRRWTPASPVLMERTTTGQTSREPRSRGVSYSPALATSASSTT
jgi:hypothetical protein